MRCHVGTSPYSSMTYRPKPVTNDGEYVLGGLI